MLLQTCNKFTIQDWNPMSWLEMPIEKRWVGLEVTQWWCMYSAITARGKDPRHASSLLNIRLGIPNGRSSTTTSPSLMSRVATSAQKKMPLKFKRIHRKAVIEHWHQYAPIVFFWPPGIMNHRPTAAFLRICQWKSPRVDVSQHWFFLGGVRHQKGP